VPGRLPEHQDSAYLRVLARYPQAKITHRLDMATSGILMFAKHRDAEVAVSKMFQARTVTKHYIALVQGKLDGEGQSRRAVNYRLGKPATSDGAF